MEEEAQTVQILFVLLISLVSILSGIAEAIQDLITLHYESLIKNHIQFDKDFWDIRESWRCKYKNTDPTYKPYHPWYLGLHEPTYQEAFPFSSTLLVFLTDGFHLVKFIQQVIPPTVLFFFLWTSHKNLYFLEYSQYFFIWLGIIYLFGNMISFHITYFNFRR